MSDYQITSNFDCPICLQTLVKPLTLICGHNFCDMCLKNNFFYETQMKCPTCRRQINVPIKKFKMNILLQTCIINNFIKDENYQQRLQSQQEFAQQQNQNWIKKVPKFMRKFLMLLKNILIFSKKLLPYVTIVLVFFLMYKRKQDLYDFTNKLEIKRAELAELINSEYFNNAYQSALKNSENTENQQMAKIFFQKLVTYLLTS